MVGQDLSEQIFKAAKDDILVGRTAGDQSVLIVLVRDILQLEGDALAQRAEAIRNSLAETVAQDSLELFGRALEDRHGATFSQSAIDSSFERLSQTGY